MIFPIFPRILTTRALCSIVLGVAFIVPLAGCDLTKNYSKIDRSSDMEVQDYRDAMAQRLPEADKSAGAGDENIPELRPYMAKPEGNLKPMPLVSISVNQGVPLRDILYELAEQADYDIELDPRIRGSIIFSARNRPFDQVIERIAESSGLRYKFGDDSVRIELDTPYHEIYKINYLNYVRTNNSTINNDIAVVSGDGADTGSKFKAEATSENNFWQELNDNLTQIVGAYRDTSSLRTETDPRISNVSEAPAPVDPILLSADGEMQLAAPNAVLRVEPLPVEEDKPASGSNLDDPFAARFSVNRQAGVISVFANERLQKQVSAYLNEVRRASMAQVLIEAKVLEVALSDEFSAGIDWNIGNAGNRFQLGAKSVGSSIAPAFVPASDPSLGLLSTFVSGDMNMTVEAMARFGTVHALASPRLTVLNNQSAVLNVAKNQVYFELDVQTQQGTDGSPALTTVNSQIRNVPEGVLINVQPSIDLDSRVISMAVRPTVTRIVAYENDPSVAFAVSNQNLDSDIVSAVPVVNVQEFDSVIQMNSGQAIVMGGLIQDNTTSNQNSIPVLGEIPLVGGLFRNQSDKVHKTELVVLLKATIVEGNNTIHNTDRDLYRTFSQDRRPFDL